jgi:DNA polymerase
MKALGGMRYRRGLIFSTSSAMRHVHLDIETFSSVDLKSAGVHKYAASPDFEILCVAYSIDYSEVKSFAPTLGDPWPDELLYLMDDEEVLWYAHNMTFERVCLKAVGIVLPVERCRCTMIMAYGSGLPGSLGRLSKILKLGDAAKDKSGIDLIKRFCLPIRELKKNNYVNRIWPEDDPEGFQALVEYCEQDVRAEMAIYHKIKAYDLPEHEWRAFSLDQRINDRGVLLDFDLIWRALRLSNRRTKELIAEMKSRTGLENPNSTKQLKEWIERQLGRPVADTTKDTIEELKKEVEDGNFKRVMELRQRTNLASIKKYTAMLKTAGPDQKARGIIQFMGAYRTWRWAGRRIQFQNIKRNYLENLDGSRAFILNRPYEQILREYPKLNDTLAQLIRTALIAGPGYKFVVADYSAIEARVLAFLADQGWRMDVFKSHGKIYEASAAQTFDVPFESITKDSPLRQQGKVTELALGYGGSVGAMRQMDVGGALDPDDEVVKKLVYKWRDRSPQILNFWRAVESAFKKAIMYRGKIFEVHMGGPVPFRFKADQNVLRILMPSGRCLNYWGPTLTDGPYGKEARYWGENDRGQWVLLYTYGGKITENIVQAYARDLLNEAQLRMDDEGHHILFSVHDEVVNLEPEHSAKVTLAKLEHLMSVAPDWAEGIPLVADGFISDYYKK